MTNVIKNVTTTETVNVMMKVVVNVIATTAPVDIEPEPVRSTVSNLIKQLIFYHVPADFIVDVADVSVVVIAVDVAAIVLELWQQHHTSLCSGQRHWSFN